MGKRQNKVNSLYLKMIQLETESKVSSLLKETEKFYKKTKKILKSKGKIWRK